MSRRKDRKANEPAAANSGPNTGALPAAPQLRHAWISPFTIVAAILLAYANTFSCPFIFDDQFAVAENESIRDLWPVWRAFWGPDETAVSGRPIVNSSFALNHAISQDNVWSYHLFNIAIHAAAALVLFGIGRRTMLLPRQRQRWGGLSGWGSFALALLWALHPLQTESVTYLTARNESLMGLFYLLTLYGFVRAADSPRPRQSRRWLAASWGACFLGMACKETMATAPVLVVLFDGCFVAASWGEVFRKRGKYHASLAATWILLGVLIAAGPREQTVGFGLQGFSPIEYLKVEAGVILTCLKLSFWPQPLVFDYGWFRPVSWGKAIVPMTVVAGMVVASIAAIRLWPGLGFLGASIFLILGPTSSVMPISEPMWEYRMYLPLASVLALALLAVRAVWGRMVASGGMAAERRRMLAVSVVAAVAVLCGGLTLARNRDYRSEFILLKDTLEKVPNNARATNNMGRQLMLSGRYEEAAHFFAEATRLLPGYANAHSGLGAALLMLDRHDEAKLSLAQAIAIEPGHANARNHLGVLHLRQGDFPAAIAEFEASIGANPGWILPRLNLCVAMASGGRREEAEAKFAEIRGMFPGHPKVPGSLDELIASHQH